MIGAYSGIPKRWVLLCVAAFSLLGGSFPARSQSYELAAGVGRGVANADDIQTVAASSANVSFKARLGRPELRFGYDVLFGHDSFPNGLHIGTVAWFIQTRSGRTRPFFQFGAAAAGIRQRTRAEYPQPDGTVQVIEHKETRFVVGPSIGAGLTVDLSKRVFLRPEIRLNFLVGSTIMTTVVPAISIGYRFGEGL
jgi:hypothetical protein